MIAYKVFNPDWRCRGFKYQIGETYEEDVNPSVCDRGFHFCKNLVDCFNYYTFDPKNKVAEIDALGDISEGYDKCCTNKIKIVKEITWYEVLAIVNTGKGNTGFGNSGDWNSGDSNSGDWNSGDSNSGDSNSGNCNTGYGNSGNRNTGYKNTGDKNSGNWNTGDKNSGDWNTGDKNSGNWNTGYGNSGNRNTGYKNSGDWNTGNRNSGDFNLSENNAGCFNVEEHKLLFFDKETDLTWYQWQNSRAYDLLRNIDSQPTKWVYAEDMTDQEKLDHPSYETTDGYLKELDINKAYQEWWDQLNGDQKQCIKEIPNFDAKKFEMITGINTEKEGNE